LPGVKLLNRNWMDSLSREEVRIGHPRAGSVV
jgi:hypothetical protein